MGVLLDILYRFSDDTICRVINLTLCSCRDTMYGKVKNGRLKRPFFHPAIGLECWHNRTFILGLDEFFYIRAVQGFSQFLHIG